MEAECFVDGLDRRGPRGYFAGMSYLDRITIDPPRAWIVDLESRGSDGNAARSGMGAMSGPPGSGTWQLAPASTTLPSVPWTPVLSRWVLWGKNRLERLPSVHFDALGPVFSAHMRDEGGAKLRVVVLREPPFDVQELGIRRGLFHIAVAVKAQALVLLGQGRCRAVLSDGKGRIASGRGPGP